MEMMRWQSCRKPCHISGTTRMHRPVPPRNSCTCRGWPFAFRDQGLARTGTSSLWLSPSGRQSPHASAQTDVGSVGRSLSSAPASVAEGAILGPCLRGLQSSSHSTSALAGPATPLPPGPSLAVACPQGRLSLFAHGAGQIAAGSPKHLFKAFPPSSKMADSASLRPAPLALMGDCRPPPHPRRGHPPPWASCPHPRWPPRLADWLGCPTPGRPSWVRWGPRPHPVMLGGPPGARKRERGGCWQHGGRWRLRGRKRRRERRRRAEEGVSFIGSPARCPRPLPPLLPPPAPPPQRPPRPLPGTMSFFRRKGRGAAGGRPGAEGRLPASSPARLLGSGPAPPGTATGPREDTRPLRSGLPANDGQSRHLPGTGPFSSLRGRGGGRGEAGALRGSLLRSGLPRRPRAAPAAGGSERRAAASVLPGAARGAAVVAALVWFFHPSSAREEYSLALLKQVTCAVRGTGVKCLLPHAVFEPLELFTEDFFFTMPIYVVP